MSYMSYKERFERWRECRIRLIEVSQEKKQPPQAYGRTEEEREAVALIQAWAEKGLSDQRIAEQLTEHEVKPRGQAWYPQTIKSILDRHGRPGTNNSQRKVSACERKWLYRYGWMLEPEKQPNYFLFGNLWSLVMDAYWGDPDADESRMPAKYGQLDAAQDAIAKWVAETPVDAEEAGITSGALAALAHDMLSAYNEEYGAEEWMVVATEAELKALLPNGQWWYGRLDKLALDVHGQLWVVDHKSTKNAAYLWAESNPYSPQLPSYAWMCNAVGLPVTGWVWDIAQKKTEPKPQDFSVLKSGKRLSYQLPSGATPNGFLTALKLYGFSLDDDDRYRELLTELKEKPRPFFHREWRRTIMTDMKRVEAELGTVAEGIEQLRQRAGGWLDDWTEAHHLELRLNQMGHLFPRQPEMCMSGYRVCEYMPICDSQDFWGFQRAEGPNQQQEEEDE